MGNETDEVSSVHVLDCDSRVGVGLDSWEVIKLVTLGITEDSVEEDSTAVDDSEALKEVKGDAVNCVVEVDVVAVVDEVDCVNDSDGFDDSDALDVMIAELVVAVLDELDKDTEGVELAEELAEVETSFDEDLEVVAAEISTTE